MSIKSLFQFLNAHQSPHESNVMLSLSLLLQGGLFVFNPCLAGILEGQAVILFLWAEDLSTTFYIPMVAS